MSTNVKTTGAGSAQPEIINELRLARSQAYDSAVIAMENLAHLRDLFRVIGSLAKAGEREKLENAYAILGREG